VSPGAIAQQAAGVELRDVTVNAQPDSVTVLVKTSREPKYQAELMDHPYRLVVDFDDTSYGWRKTPLSVDAEPLKQIRGSQYKRGVARVVVELTRSVGYAIREESNGLAIVIPTGASARGAAEPVVTAKPVAAKPAATPSAPKPQATAALAVKPEATTPKVEATKPDPMKVPDAPAPKADAAAAPALPQVAQAPAPPAPTAAPMPAPVIQTPPGGGPRLISLDFKDADVVNLLRILAAESGRNVVIGEDVKGKMSITLRNVPWDLALDTVLEAKSLVKLERDNVMRIVS
jgi:type IV pilus assembly protein PilQ